MRRTVGMLIPGGAVAGIAACAPRTPAPSPGSMDVVKIAPPLPASPAADQPHGS